MSQNNLLPAIPEVGRPPAITQDVLGKLQYAWSIGASDITACKYAGINPTTIYAYQKVNEDFTNWKNQLKQETLLAAHASVKNAIPEKPEIAFKYLEKRDERFSNKQDITVKRETIASPDQIQSELTRLLNSNPDISKRIFESISYQDMKESMDNKLKIVDITPDPNQLEINPYRPNVKTETKLRKKRKLYKRKAKLK